MPQASLTMGSRDLALELHNLLHELDPARWRATAQAQLRDRLAVIQARLRELRQVEWRGERLAALRARLDELAALIEGAAPNGRHQWRELRGRLVPAYEALAASLRESAVHVPSLRPTNYARNVLHVSTALLTIGLAEVVLGSQAERLAVTGFFAGAAWLMEITRTFSPALNDALVRAAGPTSHPHERYRINSATWYVTALLLMAAHGSLMVAVVAVAVLGVGDPIAAVLGRRFGKTKLVNGRSLEGTLAFVAAASALAAAVLAVWHPEVPWPAAAAVAVGAAVLGAVAELFTRRLDDNLVIPLAAAAGAAVMAMFLGIPM